MKPNAFARAIICTAAALGAAPSHARFLQVDRVGYDDEINLYAYVGNDPVNRTDPDGQYTCPADRKSQCAAVEAALQRAREALKSDKLSSSDRSKLTKAVNAYGKAGVDNGVHVQFASERQIYRKSGGDAYTEPDKTGLRVVFSNKFETAYSGYENMGRTKGLKIDARDERASVVAHEGQHIVRFRGGMTMESYQRDKRYFEREADAVGGLLNEAFGSDSRYCTTPQQQC